MISRRVFLDRIAVGGMCAAIFGGDRAHDQPPQSGQTPQESQPVDEGPNLVILFMRGPTNDIEETASAMKPGDSDSVRAVVEAMFEQPGVYRMPDIWRLR